MGKNLKAANHWYLRYVENKVLRSIKTYIKGGEEKETLSLRDKVLVLKLHELFDSYKDEKVGLEKFLGISGVESKDSLDKALELFEPYFLARGESEFLKQAIGRVRALKEKEEYNFLESLRRDKLEKRLRDILRHVIPERKNIRYIFSGIKDDSESFYYILHEEDFQPISKFLDIRISSSNETNSFDFTFILLSKKLKSMKIDITTLAKQHEELQEELKPYYQLAEFYFFA